MAAVRQYLDKQGLKILVDQMKQQVNKKLATVYNIKGSCFFTDSTVVEGQQVEKGLYTGSSLPSTKAEMQQRKNIFTDDKFVVGDVFNVTNDFVTFGDMFIEGNGKKIAAGTNLVVVGTLTNKKLDIFATSTDLSPYQTKALQEEFILPNIKGHFNNIANENQLPKNPQQDDQIGDFAVTTDKDVYIISKIEGQPKQITWTPAGNIRTVEGALKVIALFNKNIKESLGASFDVTNLQKKKMETGVTFNGDLFNAKQFASTGELPTKWNQVTTGGYSLNDGDIVKIDNNVHQCTIANYNSNHSLIPSDANISWQDLGDITTVEGNLAVLNAIAIVHTISKNEITDLFN